MKRIYTLVVMLVVSFGIIGCGSDELKNNLGDYQYIGLDPQLSIDIAEQEMVIKEPVNEYSLPDVELKYTINIMQNNKEFSIKKYKLFIIGSLVDEKNNKISTVNLDTDVINGVASVTNNESIYSIHEKNSAFIKSLKFKIDSYYWLPLKEFKPVSSSN